MADLAAAAALPPVPHRTRLGAFYASPVVQVVLISLICFCTPGMFNALSGVGGGGQLDPSAANKANVALYACFAVVGFLSGSVINRIGARLAFSIGAAGYALCVPPTHLTRSHLALTLCLRRYMGSLLNYNIRATNGFVVAAGALLGVSAGLLWTAQGSLVLSYATEAQKGRLFGLFWFIFNMGATLGSAIEVGLTWQSTDNTVGNAVYAAFLAIAAVGALIPFLLVDPATMVRSDGTRVIPPIHPSTLVCLARVGCNAACVDTVLRARTDIPSRRSVEERVPGHVAARQEGNSRSPAVPTLLQLQVRCPPPAPPVSSVLTSHVAAQLHVHVGAK